MQVPVSGHPLHTRSLTMTVHTATQGRWRARGDVIDLRKCSFVPMMLDLQPAGIIHHMTIELVFDPATRRVESLQVSQPHVAIEASQATGGECCRDPAPRLQALVGQTLDDDFAGKLSAEFGGPRGCSHLLTLFQLMASALPRAASDEETLQRAHPAPRPTGDRLFQRSVFVDGHETPEGGVDLGVQLTDFHMRPPQLVETSLDRLAAQRDARAYARIATQTLGIQELRAAVRQRSGDDLAGAEWHDRSSDLADLVGPPIIPGLARRIFGALGHSPEDRLLTDALLQLAPGYIQVLATLMERFFTGQSAASDDDPLSQESTDVSVASIGGMPNSCYMWRDGGRLGAMRARSSLARGRSSEGSSG